MTLYSFREEKDHDCKRRDAMSPTNATVNMKRWNMASERPRTGLRAEEHRRCP